MRLLRFALLLACLAPSTATAQVALRPNVDAQHFDPGPGWSDLLGVSGARVGPHLGVRAGLLFNVAGAPVNVDASGSSRAHVVELQTGVDVLVSISLFEWIELGVALPFTPYQSAGGSSGAFTGAGGVEGAGLSDLRIVPKLRILGSDMPVQLAISAEVTAPTGDTALWLGHGDATVTPQVSLGYTAPFGLRALVNLGYRYRPERALANIVVGSELRWGAGVEMPFEIGGHGFGVAATMTGGIGLDDAARSFPSEALLSVDWRGVEGLTVMLGGGSGFGEGIGPPEWRLFTGVAYAWSPSTEPEAPPCEFGPEDFDGFEDEDGCAEPDNDLDGVADEADRCPFEPEDADGYRDADGCPEAGSGESEQALTGGSSPSPGHDVELPVDTDGDGLPDAEDLCPAEPEDEDGFADTDGCPEPDDDGDGVLDADDRCPREAENFNGVEDTDGCPEEATSRVVVSADKIELREKVFFASGKATIRKRSFALLDEVAAVLSAHPEIRRVRIEGHTDSVGRAANNLRLSKLRAAAVRDALVERGVDADRLESDGYGSERPIDTNSTRAGRENNRRVEITIVEVETP